MDKKTNSQSDKISSNGNESQIVLDRNKFTEQLIEFFNKNRPKKLDYSLKTVIEYQQWRANQRQFRGTIK